MIDEKTTFTYFCEDCGYSFKRVMSENEDPDTVRCERCGSEFVNHELDRSLFEVLGITGAGCSPDGCSSCKFGESCTDKHTDEDELIY